MQLGRQSVSLFLHMCGRKKKFIWGGGLTFFEDPALVPFRYSESNRRISLIRNQNRLPMRNYNETNARKY